MFEQYNKITANRGMIETLVVGTMLKSLTLYGEYKVSEKDFIIDKTKFFFSLGKVMSKSHSELDQASVLEFVNTNKEFKNKYEDFGGWDSLDKAMEYGNENNIRAYVDNLAKNNLLISLHNQKFIFTEKIELNGEKFNPFEDLFPSMTCREVEEYFEGVISSCSVHSINNNIKIESLIIRKEDRERLKEKIEAGTPYDIIFEYTEKEVGLSSNEDPRYVYALPIVSTATNGLGNGGGITTVSGFSGIGKSTLTFFNYILPMIYRGEKAIVFSNEQKSQYFKSMLTSFVAANVFHNYDLSRKIIDNGDFNEEEEILMERIEKFLDDRGFEESLKFCHMEEFEVNEIMRVSKGLITHQGFTTILVDTFKSEDSSDVNYTGKIVENSKILDKFGNKYNVKVILTMQLINANEGKNSYLTGADLAECKAVKNVCDLLFLMREVVNELELDKTNKKFYLRPYKLRKNRIGDKWERQYIDLAEEDLKKEYRLLFLDKSRRGSDDLIVLLKFNGKNGRMEEVGRVEHVARRQLSY